MAEEQSSESDGYFTPEEELVCPKSEGCITSKEVSIMAADGTSFNLREADLADIIEKIYTARPKWYYIGLQLNVPVYILEDMKSEPTSICLSKVIQYWLSHLSPSPTWRTLANALRMATVGEGQLAGEIERQCSGEAARAVEKFDGSKAGTGHLRTGDLGIVLEALYDIRAKWYHLGIQLKVKSGTLESISQSCGDDLERLCQLLKHWLSNTVSASWDDLTVVLESLSFQVKGCIVLPPQPSHRCQPRQKDVEQLHLKFEDLRKKNGTDKVVTLYIVGSPAFGKTTLASLYAQDYYKGNREHVSKLFIGFVDATSRPTLLESYCILADETGHADAVKEVRQLSGSEKELLGLQLLVPLVKKELRGQTRWLLVVDNLTFDVKPLQTSKRSTALPPSVSTRRRSDWVMFIPQPGDCTLGEGLVLVTTQEGKLVEKANDCVGRHNLKDGMSPADAVELLESISGLKDSDSALEVVETLHRIPLSIAAAGYYILLERDQQDQHYGYKDYLDALKAGVQEQSEELLAEENQNYSLTLNFALDMCVHQQASNPNLYRVFILMSFCAYRPVPMRVVAHLLGQNPDINCPAMQGVRDCVLFQRSNIKMEGKSAELVSLHQTTWQLLRDKLLITVTDHAQEPGRTAAPFSDARDVSSIFQDIAAAIVAQYPHLHKDVYTNVQYYENYLQPHLESLAHFRACTSRITLAPVQEFYLYSYLGRNYRCSGQPSETMRAYEHAVEISHNCPEQQWRQSTDPERVEADLAVVYSSQGKADKAEAILRAVLTSLQVKCGENSAEFANALQGLGYAYQKMRLYEESQCCYERAVAIKNIINPVAPKTAGLNIDIGCVLVLKGDYRKSITYFEKALSAFQNMPLNSEIIKVLDYIGSAYVLLGELEQGIQAREVALHFAEKLYGLRHRRCSIISATLSFSYLRLGKFTKSITFAKKAESAIQSHSTFEHTCHSFSLVPVLVICGRFQAAEGYSSKAVECLANRGAGSEGVSKIVPPLVAALCGRTTVAQGLVQQFLASSDLRQQNDRYHLHLLLASCQVQLELGRYAEGLKLLPIIEGELDGKDSVASDLLPLLTLANDPECIWESAGAIHEYLRTIQSFLSSNVPPSEYFNTIRKGFKAFRQKEFCKAEQCFSDALAHDCKEETDRQSNLVSLDTRRMYGTSLYHQDKLLEAAKCLEECLSSARSLCSRHPLVAKISYTLAQVYGDRGQKELAVPRLKEALAIFESSYEEHPLIATIAAAISS